MNACREKRLFYSHLFCPRARLFFKAKRLFSTSILCKGASIFHLCLFCVRSGPRMAELTWVGSYPSAMLIWFGRSLSINICCKAHGRSPCCKVPQVALSTVCICPFLGSCEPIWRSSRASRRSPRAQMLSFLFSLTFLKQGYKAHPSRLPH